MVIEVGSTLRNLDDVVALHQIATPKVLEIPHALRQPAHRRRDDLQRFPY